MNRRYNNQNWQQVLLGSAVCALGTIPFGHDERVSKPDSREAP